MNDVTPQAAAPEENTAATVGTPDSGSPDTGTLAAETRARPGRVRRAAFVWLPVATALAGVVLSAVYVKITVDGADRSTSTRLWAEPARKPAKDPAGDVVRGRVSTELSKLLLPVPSGYRLGPDQRDLGNDGELSGKRAAAAMKQSARGLAGKERRAYEERIDKLRIEGIAVRTYVDEDNTLMISTEITRVKNRKAVRDLYGFRTGLMGALDLFREGPKIKEHTKKATCFTPRKGSGDDLASMDCFAYDGEMSITLRASGTKPFDRTAVADLLKDQLNHLTSPGEYV
ncbi:hypothetical protein AB0467_23885 [Streptomyces sp. NPDC052095]|uniref:hypothetical protein n=1 Tax=unclassified Streptomyces TaxID=2593676 RepID=UPI003450EB1C